MRVSVNLNIESEDAAFGGGNASAEVARILKKVATELEDAHSNFECKLRDVNGNTVGKFQFLIEEEIEEEE